MAKKSMTEVIESVKEDICDNYCKYPGQYQMEHEDSEEGYDLMLSEVCAECPLNRL